MDTGTDNLRKISIVLMIVYLLALTWIVVFSMSFPPPVRESAREVHAVPFVETYEMNGSAVIPSFIVTAMLFLPIGVYGSLITPHWLVISKVIPVLLLSTVFEVFLFIFNIGIFDTTDICLAGIGAVAGIIIEYVLRKNLACHHYRVMSIAMSVFTVFVVMYVALNITQ